MTVAADAVVDRESLMSYRLAMMITLGAAAATAAALPLLCGGASAQIANTGTAQREIAVLNAARIQGPRTYTQGSYDSVVRSDQRDFAAFMDQAARADHPELKRLALAQNATYLVNRGECASARGLAQNAGDVRLARRIAEVCRPATVD